MIHTIQTNTALPRISEEYAARIVEGCPSGGTTLGVPNGDCSLDFA